MPLHIYHVYTVTREIEAKIEAASFEEAEAHANEMQNNEFERVGQWVSV